MKKIVLAVLLLTVVSTVITLGFSNRGFMPFMTGMPMDGPISSIQTSPMTGPEYVAEDRRIVEGEGMMMNPEIYPYYPADNALSQSSRYYDRTANYSLVVANVSEFLRTQRELILSKEGQVLYFTQGKSDKYEFGYISAAVPMSIFDETVRQLETEAVTIVNVNQSMSDITGQVSRLEKEQQNIERNILELEAQLEEAQTAAERRKIEYQLESLRQQLEQIKTSREQVEEEVLYGTLDVSVADSQRYFDPSIKGSWTEEIQKAFESLQSTGGVLLAGLIWMLVYAIIWIPALLAGRWLWRYLRRSTR